jgi:hypothetical protein
VASTLNVETQNYREIHKTILKLHKCNFVTTVFALVPLEQHCRNPWYLLTVLYQYLLRSGIAQLVERRAAGRTAGVQFSAGSRLFIFATVRHWGPPSLLSNWFRSSWAWSWPLITIYCWIQEWRSYTSPRMSSWRGTWLIERRNNFTLLTFITICIVFVYIERLAYWLVEIIDLLLPVLCSRIACQNTL